MNLTRTLASFLPLRLLRRSGRRSARIDLVEDNPRQNNKLSMMFDLPEPFGPEMVVKPSSSGITVDRPKDLKLSSSISLIRKRSFRPSSPAELHYTLYVVSSIMVLNLVPAKIMGLIAYP